jgi:hypothetical protein
MSKVLYCADRQLNIYHRYIDMDIYNFHQRKEITQRYTSNNKSMHCYTDLCQGHIYRKIEGHVFSVDVGKIFNKIQFFEDVQRRFQYQESENKIRYVFRN